MADNNIEFNEKHLEMIVDMNSRLKNVENQVTDLSDMKENIKLLTYLQQRSEERDIKSDKINEEQIKINTEVAFNLRGLNDEVKQTNSKIDKLECKFYSAEDKNKIDIREVNKEQVKEKLTLKEKVKKYAFPFGAISGFVVAVWEILKGIKVIK